MPKFLPKNSAYNLIYDFGKAKKEDNIIKLFNEKYINLINIPSGDWFNK